VSSLSAERKNATRWYSIYKMLLKWSKLRGPIREVENFSDDVLSKIPTAAENNLIITMLDDLGKFESVSKVLQISGEGQPDMFGARCLFDELLAEFHVQRASLHHLEAYDSIVNNPDFEMGLVKIQSGREAELSVAEKEAVKIFKKTPAAVAAAAAAAAPVVGFADQVLIAAAQQKKQRLLETEYKDTRHVKVDNNNCERLFSLAKLVNTPQRGNMDPDTLETFLFLKANKDLWENPTVMQEILNERGVQEGEDGDEEEEEA
jgi:hypothetical protein